MKVAVYDAGHYSGWAGNSWLTGGRLCRALKKFDLVIPVLLWDQVYSELQRLPDGVITDLQIWCHGFAGGVVLGREVISGSNINPPFWHGITRKVSRFGRVWFRSSGTFAGIEGQAFAKKIANTMDRKVVGHTHAISFFQSGLREIRPGLQTTWSVTEGVRARKGNYVELKTSGLFAPSTVTCLHTDF